MSYNNNQIPPMPLHTDPVTQRRVEHLALRRRMLCGQWLQDLIDEISNHIPESRQATWGVPDMSSNVFKSATSALCGLYAEPPTVGVSETSEGQAQGLVGRQGLIHQAGLWALMQRVQFFTIGMNETFLRVDMTDDGQGLLYRIVTADMVQAEASAGDPSRPHTIKELRLRYCNDMQKYEWTIDHLSIKDLGNPVYEIYTVNANGARDEDVTAKYLEQTMSGAQYPYRDSAGVPFLPYSLYHSEIHGELFDSFSNRECVMGSLNASVLYTYFLHLARDCSHPQRYLMGATLAGLDTFDNNLESRRQAIASDPASILVFAPDPDLAPGQQPQIGQYQAGGDVSAMLESITVYERRLATYMGINPADIQKMSGDPRSGFAISISRSSLRESQRKYAPAFRRADIETLEISAKIANRYMGTSYPETGYRIEYHAIPLSPQESKEQRENMMALLQAGLISKVDAIQILHPDLDDLDAKKMLLKIQQDNLSF
jgi:hypothetical protein